MTRRGVGAWALAMALLWVVVPAAAQAPTVQQTCEDTARTLRILAEQYATSRQRVEIEAAQTLAGLVKQIEALRAQIQALEAEKKKSAEPKKEDGK